MKRRQKLTNEQWAALQHIIKNSKNADEVRKAQAIILVNDHAPISAIIALTGYKRRQIYTLRSNYIKSGIDSIIDHRKGKPKELLTKNQRAEIVAMIQANKPCEMNTAYQNCTYWTTGLLGSYIQQSYGVAYKSKTSHYLLFKQAKFTYHKPGKVSERRNDVEVEEWRIEVKKHIQAAWNDPNVVILAEDEMHLSTQTTVQKIWLPQGEYPKIEVARKRDARSIYGFLNIKTGEEHAFKTKWQNMYITATIIPEIRKCYPNKKLLFVWDQAGWHKGKEAQQAIKEDGHIDTIYFPTAAPDENPQEHVWKSGRSHIVHNEFIQNIDEATDKFVTFLNNTTFPYSLLGFSAVS